MKTRVILYADEGKVLTNGETYGRQIFLAEDADMNDYYEITEEEYNKSQKSEQLEIELDNDEVIL